MQLAAAARFALAVHEDLLEFEQVARFPAGVDQVGELQQLAQANHLAAYGDGAPFRHLWECGDMTLPQLSGGLFVTDGGLETDLIFNRGVALPEFAAFVLLDDVAGMSAITDYYKGFFDIAREHGAGFILGAPTWRANPDWGARLGYDPTRLADANRRWADVVVELRAAWTDAGVPVVLDGQIGPRGDGYVPGECMTGDEAAAYHGEQIAAFAETPIEMVTAMTVNYAEEAVGVARAAAAHDLPSVISFTVETDGRLATGQPLAEAIDQVDSETGDAPAYFMVNCAHPTHFEHVELSERIAGIRANASQLSHAELDETDELDRGDPDELADGYERLATQLPNLTVLGGCCGTDHRHVAAIMERLT
jgi:S-methylmethionine-dependent homocysteine/selenocysteine methylase